MLETVAEAIGCRRYNYSCEAELQTAIASVLSDCSIPFSQEHRLNQKDRLDLKVEGLAIEVKVGGSLTDLMRQVHRYAQSEEITAVLVVTSRSKHRSLPTEMNGKPVRVLYLNPL